MAGLAIERSRAAQAVNASSGKCASAGQANARLRALGEMLLIPGGVRARFPRNGGDCPALSDLPVGIAEQVSAEAHDAAGSRL